MTIKLKHNPYPFYERNSLVSLMLLTIEQVLKRPYEWPIRYMLKY